MDYNSKCKKIFSDYLNIVTPLITRYEVLSNTFPIGILNEMRAIFTHLAKANEASESNKEKEINKACGHLTRMIRDAYKYNCLALENKYSQFVNLILKNNTNLSEELNEQIKLIYDTHEIAIGYLFVARQLENSVDSDSIEDQIYENYKKAVNEFEKVDELIKQVHK